MQEVVKFSDAANEWLYLLSVERDCIGCQSTVLVVCYCCEYFGLSDLLTVSVFKDTLVSVVEVCTGRNFTPRPDKISARPIFPYTILGLSQPGNHLLNGECDEQKCMSDAMQEHLNMKICYFLCGTRWPVYLCHCMNKEIKKMK